MRDLGITTSLGVWVDDEDLELIAAAGAVVAHTKASRCGVELSSSPLHDQDAFVSHADAVVTLPTRGRPAGLLVEEGWTVSAPRRCSWSRP